MERLLLMIFIIQAIYYAGCSDDRTFGKPLFLTPIIECGNIAEGRRLARVNFPETPDIESYAGHFTVNKTYDSNQFLWYFPSIRADRKLAPVILWLQGGPGASALFNLFAENGPISVEDGKFTSREYNWALDHHLIYIDNPVGTGFSFTKRPGGYLTDETQIGVQLHSTLTQFFKLFPELQQNKFFIAGESYAGKYVPALAYTIHKKNPSAETKINLQGISIGNGLSDPERQLVYSKFLYQIGLIDQHEQKAFEDYEAEAKNYIKNCQWDDAYDAYDILINGVTTKSYFHNVTGFNFFFNYLYTEDYTTVSNVVPMLQRSDVRNAIHVGDLPFNGIAPVVSSHLKQDFTKSVAPCVSELLDHYPCVIYNGQLDIALPYPQTVEYLLSLNFTGAEEYRTADRHIWKVDGEIAGYVKEGGNLLEIMVRNAGHSVIIDQPKWALDLITRFTHDIAFYDEDENGSGK